MAEPDPHSLQVAVCAAVEKARPLSAADEATAVQAMALAAQFDYEAAEGNSDAMTKLSRELREVLADLRVEGTGDGAADGWDADAELARLTRSGPTLGDPA